MSRAIIAPLAPRFAELGPSDPESIPPLESGDNLTRDEFERRYEAMPEVKKAELINGVVYMGSPVRFRNHARPHSHIVTWLGNYEAATPGTLQFDNTTVRLDEDNEPQPDAGLMIEADRGGQAIIDRDDYIRGAPELIVEVAASSASRDLNIKKRAYELRGVREYVVWRVRQGALDWFELSEGAFVRRALDAEGLHKSVVFPGLSLDPMALLRGDLAAVLDRLRLGLASPEHAEFVARLNPPEPAASTPPGA